MLVALAVIWGYFYCENPLFLSPRNLSNLSMQIVVTGTVALGMFFVLVIGEIDLSVAAVGAVSAAISANLAVNMGAETTTAVVAGLALGACIGFLQGLAVTVFRAPSFIVTLGTSLALQGALLQLLPQTSSLISLVGQPLGNIGNTYLPARISVMIVAILVVTLFLLRIQDHLGRRNEGAGSGLLTGVITPVAIASLLGVGVIVVFDAYRGVPMLVAILLVLLSFFAYITAQTRFGLYLFAIGANAEAARRAGIYVSTLRIAGFTLTGLFAAIGGMMAAGRVLAVSPDSADSTLLLEAIAAAVIGGISLFGGRGSVWSALIGALVIGSVSNGMLLINASTSTRLEVQGAILTLAVVLDALLSRRALRR
ncbi:ABC transporter permease [Mesorhizobium sp. VK24D]|uniref:Xylose transport system permease protein XylH n=1 Tax=Mesorhizobium album TaxID=3072314 RepID=A0ABU4Y8A8_9HYPH|nr:ABC transporter permease [Mesorhizobium sp. VK24D]MDX8482543.1 ABC transporter permease [Mesorhizobium sp. VK24D]